MNKISIGKQTSRGYFNVKYKNLHLRKTKTIEEARIEAKKFADILPMWEKAVINDMKEFGFNNIVIGELP